VVCVCGVCVCVCVVCVCVVCVCVSIKRLKLTDFSTVGVIITFGAVHIGFLCSVIVCSYGTPVRF
jgi:hypothetical protein